MGDGQSERALLSQATPVLLSILCFPHLQAYLCTDLGFHDDWLSFHYTQQVKLYLSLCCCLQLLKVIKFINVFVPKMALATSVLSHGMGDLFMFTLFFFFSIFAFSQMFMIQLGPYLDDCERARISNCAVTGSYLRAP